MIIDTLPNFMRYWSEAQHMPLDEQIERWAHGYLSQWPELLQKQVEDYAVQDIDWRQIARAKVFPFLSDRLPSMQEAHQALLANCEPILARSRQVLGFDFDTTFVIYVGIGCGAGWATTYGGRPSVLFGLENIAECGWSDEETIRGLIAHEIGHLIHHSWRKQNGKPIGSGSWWQLYEEGFAQECESRILGTDAPHQAMQDEESGWLAWCREHTAWLAAEFLHRVEAGEPVMDFFGSWFTIQGHSETGYYLGQEIMKELLKSADLKEIAMLEDVESATQPVVEKMAKASPVLNRTYHVDV